MHTVKWLVNFSTKTQMSSKLTDAWSMIRFHLAFESSRMFFVRRQSTLHSLRCSSIWNFLLRGRRRHHHRFRSFTVLNVKQSDTNLHKCYFLPDWILIVSLFIRNGWMADAKRWLRFSRLVFVFLAINKQIINNACAASFRIHLFVDVVMHRRSKMNVATGMDLLRSLIWTDDYAVYSEWMTLNDGLF